MRAERHFFGIDRQRGLVNKRPETARNRRQFFGCRQPGLTFASGSALGAAALELAGLDSAATGLPSAMRGRLASADGPSCYGTCQPGDPSRWMARKPHSGVGLQLSQQRKHIVEVDEQGALRFFQPSSFQNRAACRRMPSATRDQTCSGNAAGKRRSTPCKALSMRSTMAVI